MRRPRAARPNVDRSAFAGLRFPSEVITVAVRWYLRYGFSYRDVEELLAEPLPPRGADGGLRRVRGRSVAVRPSEASASSGRKLSRGWYPSIAATLLPPTDSGQADLGPVGWPAAGQPRASVMQAGA